MSISREAVRFILQNAEQFPWTIQGLGMLRLYLRPEVRLHVWSGEFRREGVSTIHDHPWDFESEVISGWIENYLYQERPQALPFSRQQIVCGPAGGEAGQPEPVDLLCYRRDWYRTGQSYRQKADEIHETVYENGTVTIIRRHFRPDTEHAHVFYERGQPWVSAIPRPATSEEIHAAAATALGRWRE